MMLIESIQALRDFVKQCQGQSERLAFVPTMGNLHRGHLELVQVAKQHADKVVVSIFVNPLQFAPGADFEDYPRTLQADIQKLSSYDVDVVFTPSADEMYRPEHQSADINTVIDVTHLSTILCGHYRPGHFQGVSVVVSKLFNLVQPDVAVFGEKDFQQLTIIQKMVSDLCYPISIVGVPTVREENGLALSSRNQYLSNDERVKAAEIYQTLLEVKEKVEGRQSTYTQIETEAMQRLQASGFRPEYVSIREPDDLDPGRIDSDHLQVLVAAWLGEARLIDNLKIR